jgi:hypothetical protein
MDERVGRRLLRDGGNDRDSEADRPAVWLTAVFRDDEKAAAGVSSAGSGNCVGQGADSKRGS